MVRCFLAWRKNITTAWLNLHIGGIWGYKSKPKGIRTIKFTSVFTFISIYKDKNKVEFKTAHAN